MHRSIMDLPPAFETPVVTIRLADWGDMTVEVGDVRQTSDSADSTLFKGLPDDRCQCPHWGYVVKGKLRLQFADYEEVYSAGEVYYAAPGHIPIPVAGCQYLDFSPKEEMHRTMEVLERNMKAMQSAGRPAWVPTGSKQEQAGWR